MYRSRSMKFAALLLATSLKPLLGAEGPLLESDVLPILTKNCMGCHGGLRKEGGLDLRTVPAILAGGESGPAIVAGDVDKSELWRRVCEKYTPKKFRILAQLGCFS